MSDTTKLDEIRRAAMRPEIGRQLISRVLSDESLDCASLHYQKAKFFCHFGDDRVAAFKEIERALKLERHPRALCLRGWLKKRALDFDGALQDYDEAVRMAPDDPRALLGRAHLRLKIDDPAGTATDFAAAYELEPPVIYDRWIELGEAHLLAGQLQQAIAAFDRAMACPGRAATVISMKLAEAKERSGDLSGALKDLEGAETAPGLREQAHEMIRKIKGRLSQEPPEK